ncbi:helix-turn-helix DNA binding domain protein [Gordonia phage Sixama]|uniref:Helix-turn-helix DNA binding domain protein n=1 Tax=Gordonia phage Sixama TaxID=2653271 RepID=A0A5Q2F110_9CAUD|nr:helix-turn-helix DNA binding domain protein [Gordonia phage Sixama]QGF20209.1 helix-turn-helix DNA binding domain protein [Gordonia phage Sixama]
MAWSESARDAKRNNLAKRQIKVGELWVQGLNEKEIAKSLSASVSTIKLDLRDMGLVKGRSRYDKDTD